MVGVLFEVFGIEVSFSGNQLLTGAKKKVKKYIF